MRAMIFENTGLVGLKSDLLYLDESATKAGFIRWQWEYYRATYDCKIEDPQDGGEYFLRINTRAVEGKLEKADAVLAIEAVYLGKATFPMAWSMTPRCLNQYWTLLLLGFSN